MHLHRVIFLKNVTYIEKYSTFERYHEMCTVVDKLNFNIDLLYVLKVICIKS